MLLDIDPNTRTMNSTLATTRDRVVDDPKVALLALLMRTAQAVEQRRVESSDS
jgi:hypothetical protein